MNCDDDDHEGAGEKRGAHGQGSGREARSEKAGEPGVGDHNGNAHPCHKLRNLRHTEMEAVHEIHWIAAEKSKDRKIESEVEPIEPAQTAIGNDTAKIGEGLRKAD